MELFQKAKAIRLRSRHDKYLLAEDDEESVCQDRDGLSKNARWTVEFTDESHVIRLKSCYGTYLTASNASFLLGMTGKKVLQTLPNKLDSSVEWEPMRDGFHVTLKTRHGKFLRANGGLPPWRNSITHDVPNRTATQDWVLWEIEVLEIRILSPPRSPPRSPTKDHLPLVVASSPANERLGGSSKFSKLKKAKAVRLRSHHDKFLFAEDDEESVCQERDGASKNARWTVEFVEDESHVLRLKSCYGKYLTASNLPFLLGMTGKKVMQTLPRRLDSSVEWEPLREGFHIKLKTRYGNFLRANAGLPPWRNSITHDVPHRTSTQDWILWEIDIVEIRILPPPRLPPQDQMPHAVTSRPSEEKLGGSPRLGRLQTLPSFTGSPPKPDGRVIYYAIADDSGDVDDALEWPSFLLKGTNVHQLAEKLEEETGINDIIICSRSPLNGKLYPLRLQLPPNNTAMHVIIVKSSSRLAKDLVGMGSPTAR